jgi:alkylation response protein AidB-like acyl-CoA dehydrogenase
MVDTKTDWLKVVEEVGPQFAQRAAEHDEEDKFVAENYAALKERRFFSALVPRELGGGGATHQEVCRALRELAHYCSSTALSVSMHQHLVSTSVWNYRRGNPGKQLLEKVAAEELVLISTGAKDWLGSNGTMERTDGGWKLSATKIFASGSPAGNILVTSAPYEDPDEGWQVLHFPVPFSTEGVHIKENWLAHGMRGTGSNTVILDNVYIPEGTVVLRRPRDEYHPFWNVVLAEALPLITSVYVGVAEAAATIARENAQKRRDDPTLPFLLGEMENALATAQMAVESMIAIANEHDFEPVVENANAIVIRKTVLVQAVIKTTEKALESVGGAGYFRSLGLERLLRDARAGQFHPLQEKRQLLFTGRLALGLDPIQSQ